MGELQQSGNRQRERCSMNSKNYLLFSSIGRNAGESPWLWCPAVASQLSPPILDFPRILGDNSAYEVLGVRMSLLTAGSKVTDSFITCQITSSLGRCYRFFNDFKMILPLFWRYKCLCLCDYLSDRHLFSWQKRSSLGSFPLHITVVLQLLEYWLSKSG